MSFLDRWLVLGPQFCRVSLAVCLSVRCTYKLVSERLIVAPANNKFTLIFPVAPPPLLFLGPFSTYQYIKGGDHMRVLTRGLLTVWLPKERAVRIFSPEYCYNFNRPIDCRARYKHVYTYLGRRQVRTPDGQYLCPLNLSELCYFNEECTSLQVPSKLPGQMLLLQAWINTALACAWKSLTREEMLAGHGEGGKVSFFGLLIRKFQVATEKICQCSFLLCFR